MATLEIEAENVSGSTSEFLLLGLRRKGTVEPVDAGETEGTGLVVVEFTTPDDWDVVVRLHHPSVAPGEKLCESVLVDVDCFALRWHVPSAHQGRFHLHNFTWQGRPLLEKPGRI